ncbi:VITF-3 subunit protein [Bernardetia litoralis DSM 6794]|uniref:VITF-3 subunit protein n=1 Tax=Bernardetia litoralis (strain ATCC 23117 / DSM 6794 / NBRC 15988 / NCIMB 1366 / Fx l1 / Sio-4) TaxID=880071 RepID=I4AM92_BERLS|nr:hypothetical protein [Bernardetia litoralis]AFM05077.1 VITF-3 subunit protein [Bernardetia litoralis DSM 6794]
MSFILNFKKRLIISSYLFFCIIFSSCDSKVSYQAGEETTTIEYTKEDTIIETEEITIIELEKDSFSDLDSLEKIKFIDKTVTEIDYLYLWHFITPMSMGLHGNAGYLYKPSFYYTKQKMIRAVEYSSDKDIWHFYFQDDNNVDSTSHPSNHKNVLYARFSQKNKNQTLKTVYEFYLNKINFNDTRKNTYLILDKNKKNLKEEEKQKAENIFSQPYTITLKLADNGHLFREGFKDLFNKPHQIEMNGILKKKD